MSVWTCDERSDHIQFLLSRGAAEEHFNLPVDIFRLWQETWGIFQLKKNFWKCGKKVQKFPSNVSGKSKNIVQSQSRSSSTRTSVEY